MQRVARSHRPCLLRSWDCGRPIKADLLQRSRVAKQNYYTYFTSYGPLSIAARGKCVTNVALEQREFPGAFEPSETTNRCATQILQYLSGKRKGFDLQLAPEGTAFQKRVWASVEKIPYGQTRTASQVAKAIGAEGSARSVGAALSACPIAILIPIHRMVRADGYTRGEDKQARLGAACLLLEKKVIEKTRS